MKPPKNLWAHVCPSCSDVVSVATDSAGKDDFLVCGVCSQHPDADPCHVFEYVLVKRVRK